MLDGVAVAALLTHVLDRDVDPAGVTLARPSGGGWSNETVFVTTPAVGRRLVLRVAPEGHAMFPAYDLARQHHWMTTVAAAGTVPVPAILGADLDGVVLGRSAFVMEHVDGRVPSDDRPSFVEAGWLHDARPADQRHFHERLLDAIAGVHAVPPDDDGVAGGGCRALLDDLRRTWDFDRGAVWNETIDDRFQQLAEDAPATTGDVLLWGDARPANVIVEHAGFGPIALLDWELAATGPAEIDVTWLAEMDRMRATSAAVPPLPGFLDDEAAIGHYECVAGRTLDAEVLAWSIRFNVVRIAVLMHRHLRVMVQHGELPPDHRILSDNVATRRVAQLAV